MFKSLKTIETKILDDFTASDMRKELQKNFEKLVSQATFSAIENINEVIKGYNEVAISSVTLKRTDESMGIQYIFMCLNGNSKEANEVIRKKVHDNFISRGFYLEYKDKEFNGEADKEYINTIEIEW